MRTGRPTDYTPDLGDKILKLMQDGFSLAAAAAKCDIHRQRVYEWVEKYPDFADTIRLAKGKRQYFLEDRLLTADEGPVVTSTIFALKNAAGEDWRDKVTQEVTGADGGAIVTRDESPQSALEIARVLAFALEKGVRAAKDDSGSET